VVIGHNGHHAWGVTTEAADTQDLFIERVNPNDPGQYEVDGRYTDFEVREETLEVAGGDDVTYEVRTSRHGPVISGTLLGEDEFDGSSTIEIPDQYVVALAWKTLEPSTLVEAIIGINLASSYEEFASAVALWDIAAQNVVYADVEGNIAYHSTGEIPLRASGDGLLPVPGWTTEHDWVGTVPFESMPRLLNPEQSFVASANQPVLRPGSEPLIGIDASYGYRAGRIGDMILAGSGHTVASMQEMQFDSRDTGAEVVVPYLLALDAGGDDTVAEMQTHLEGWAGGGNAFQADGRSSGAAVYMGVWRHLLAGLFHDDLPEDYWPTGDSRWFEVVRLLLERPDGPWWDVSTTADVETRDIVLRQAMLDAHAEVAASLGDDITQWSWGDLHIAHFENQTLGQSGIAPIEWLFNRTAPPRVGGSSALVNAVGWNTALSYEVDWVPSQRMVIDMSDLDASTFAHTTGQSGHAFAANYDDMIEMWADSEQGPMPWTRPAVEAIATDRLMMVPPD
jgi:penicillin amidase